MGQLYAIQAPEYYKIISGLRSLIIPGCSIDFPQLTDVYVRDAIQGNGFNAGVGELNSIVFSYNPIHQAELVEVILENSHHIRWTLTDILTRRAMRALVDNLKVDSVQLSYPTESLIIRVDYNDESSNGIDEASVGIRRLLFGNAVSALQ